MKLCYESFEMENNFSFLYYTLSYNNTSDLKYYHYHDCLEITVVWDGQVEYNFYDGTKVIAQTGDVVLVNNLEPHCVYGQNQDAKISVLTFLPKFVFGSGGDTDFAFIENFFSGQKIFSNYVSGKNDFCLEIKSLIQQIDNELKYKQDGYKLMVKTKLMTILAILYRYQPKKIRMYNSFFTKKSEDLNNFILENCHRDLSMQECAEFCSYSPAYFSKMFHDNWGICFKDYLTKIRIEKSIHLLLDGKLSIKEIYNKSGFGSYSAYLVAFKKVTGKTPIKYISDMV